MRKLKLDELGRISTDEFRAIPKNPLILILDNIRSMHNVGSILRSADAFLIEKVYLCGITPKPPHREIRKTAIGAEESVDWQAHDDIPELITQLKADGYKIFSLEQAEATTPLHQFESKLGEEKYAVILGHEVNGVSQELVDMSDIVLEIPQFGTKHSLNVSVAAGIVLHELVLGRKN